MMPAAAAGNVAHVVKKGSEEENLPEWEFVKRWVKGRPLNTLGALAAGQAIAVALAPQLTAVALAAKLVIAFFVGFGGDSAINRAATAVPAEQEKAAA